MVKNKEVGDVWEDEFGNEYEIIDVNENIVISQSVNEITDY